MAPITSTDKEQQSMRPFFVIWTGQAFSLLGSTLVQFAIVWWLTKQTGSATILALATLAALLPQILIGPFAGALVDRWSRRTIMIAADAAIAIATLALIVLFWLNLAAVWSIYVLLLIRAAGGSFHWPAMQASTTMLVPKQHLPRVAGLNQTLSGIAGIFIPPLGALVIEILPMQAVLAIDVLTAIPAIASLFFTTIPQPVRPDSPRISGGRPTIWADMREGFRFVWSWKALMILAVIAIMINMLGRAAASLAPLLITKHFSGGVVELGWWQAAIGIGSVLGGVTLGVWGGFRRKVFTQNLLLVVDGIAIVAIALCPPDAIPFAVVGIFLVAALETIAIGLGGAIFQVIVPPEMQGRVFALLISVTQALSPLGLLVAGPVADAFGVPFWWVLTGIVIAIMGACALLIPSVMHVEDAHSALPAQISLHP